VLAKVVIKITLPASIIFNFSGQRFDTSMLSLMLIGLGAGLLYMGIGYFGNRKKGSDQQAFELLNLSGYNIGNFTMPFVQSFLGPIGVITTSLFDVGNACICLGGAYSLAAMVKDGNGFSVKKIVSALTRSVPFMTYMIMLLVNLLRLNVPSFILSVANIGTNANAFMAMLMIGVGFKLELSDKKQVGTIVKLLSLRYSIAFVFALVFYFVLPFPLEVRQALVILACSPIGSAVPGFTEQLKGDVGLSSALNSFAMVISITITVILLLVML
jgi:predicted permease